MVELRQEEIDSSSMAPTAEIHSVSDSDDQSIVMDTEEDTAEIPPDHPMLLVRPDSIEMEIESDLDSSFRYFKIESHVHQAGDLKLQSYSDGKTK